MSLRPEPDLDQFNSSYIFIYCNHQETTNKHRNSLNPVFEKNVSQCDVRNKTCVMSVTATFYPQVKALLQTKGNNWIL